MVQSEFFKILSNKAYRGEKTVICIPFMNLSMDSNTNLSSDIQLRTESDAENESQAFFGFETPIGF
jgi:hypothetical protein